MNFSVFVRLSIMMFLQFFIWGAWYVTGPNYLGTKGFTGGDFGWMYSVGPIAGMLSPFFVGMIADRFFSTERVLGLMHLLGGAAMCGAIALMLQEKPNPNLINLLFFAHMLTYFPTLALTNTLAMHNMTNSEKEFPFIRVFGTIGWIAAGQLVSFLLWDSKVDMFYLAAGASFLLGLFSFTLPHTPPPNKGKEFSAREALGIDAFVLLKQPSFFMFMLSSFLICIPLAFYYQLAGRAVQQTGLPTGSTMSYGQMSEIIFMVLMPFFFARLGVKWMLGVGMLAWVVRYALFAIGAPDQIAWMLIAGVVLHGICYDFFFVTGQIYTDKTAPKQIRGQAQGMLVLFTLGLGMFIGAQATGMVEKMYTPPETLSKLAQVGALGDALKASNEELAKKTANNEKLAAELEKSAAQLDKITAEASPALAEQFQKRADEKLKPISEKIAATEKSLAAAKGTEAEKMGEQLKELRKQKADEILSLAGTIAKTEVARLEPPLPEATAAALALKKQNAITVGYKNDLEISALQLMNWKMIWAIPAVFAGAVMLLFLLIFRDGNSGQIVEKAKPATDQA